jgi:hypothetical protein
MVHLSIKGFSNIPFDRYSKTFEFIHEGQTYPYDSRMADFLSPHVARLHKMDPTIDRFEVCTESVFDGSFEQFLSFGYGQEVSPTDENIKDMLRFASALGNTELYELLMSHVVENLEVQTVCNLLCLKADLGVSYKRELEFAALSFSQLSEADIDSLGVSLLWELLSHKFLALSSEDSLYAFLSARFDSDPSYFQMLELVNFEFLSENMILKFIEDSHEFFDCLNLSVWDKITRRLKLTPTEPSYQKMQFSWQCSAPLNGIIAHLTQVCGGNVHDKGAVVITASGTWSNFLAKHLADLESHGHFCSTNSPKEWVCYDFMDMRVCPTHYTLRSYIDGTEDRANPRSWVIEVSNDKNMWVEIDRQTKNPELNGSDLVRSFSCICEGKWRFVRMRTTGKNCRGDYALALTSFELFGSLFKRN